MFLRKYGKITSNKKKTTHAADILMIDYMKKHENYINEMLEKILDEEKVKELLAYHDKQIQWIQHERLTHLIVMLFVCLFTLLSFGFTVIKISTPAIVLEL